MCHTAAIRKIIELGARPSIVPWLCSFLTDRQYSVRFKGTQSSWQPVEAGVPQGTRLGPILFLALIDDVMRDQPTTHWKYVDDMSIAISHNPRDQSGADQLRHALLALENWCRENYVKLNAKKCVTFQVSFNRAIVPQAEIRLSDENLEQVNETKILGVIVQDNLKWGAHVENIVSRASSRLFMLRTLKAFSCPIEDLVTVFTGFIRPVLEYACPVWHSSLTQSQNNSIENIQKRALRIILSSRYCSYENALSTTNLQTLSSRREQLCLSFARKTFKTDTGEWFTPVVQTRNLRNHRVCVEPKSKTNRYKNSPIPFFASLLNKNGY